MITFTDIFEGTASLAVSVCASAMWAPAGLYSSIMDIISFLNGNSFFYACVLFLGVVLCLHAGEILNHTKLVLLQKTTKNLYKASAIMINAYLHSFYHSLHDKTMFRYNLPEYGLINLNRKEGFDLFIKPYVGEVYLPLPSHKKKVQWTDQVPGKTADDLVSIRFIPRFGKGIKRGKIYDYHGPLIHKTGISFINFIKDMITSALIVALYFVYAKIKAQPLRASTTIAFGLKDMIASTRISIATGLSCACAKIKAFVLGLWDLIATIAVGLIYVLSGIGGLFQGFALGSTIVISGVAAACALVVLIASLQTLAKAAFAACVPSIASVITLVGTALTDCSPYLGIVVFASSIVITIHVHLLWRFAVVYVTSACATFAWLSNILLKRDDKVARDATAPQQNDNVQDELQFHECIETNVQMLEQWEINQMLAYVTNQIALAKMLEQWEINQMLEYLINQVALAKIDSSRLQQARLRCAGQGLVVVDGEGFYDSDLAMAYPDSSAAPPDENKEPVPVQRCKPPQQNPEQMEDAEDAEDATEPMDCTPEETVKVPSIVVNAQMDERNAETNTHGPAPSFYQLEIKGLNSWKEQAEKARSQGALDFAAIVFNAQTDECNAGTNIPHFKAPSTPLPTLDHAPVVAVDGKKQRTLTHGPAPSFYQLEIKGLNSWKEQAEKARSQGALDFAAIVFDIGASSDIVQATAAIQRAFRKWRLKRMGGQANGLSNDEEASDTSKEETSVAVETCADNVETDFNGSGEGDEAFVPEADDDDNGDEQLDLPQGEVEETKPLVEVVIAAGSYKGQSAYVKRYTSKMVYVFLVHEGKEVRISQNSIGAQGQQQVERGQQVELRRSERLKRILAEKKEDDEGL